MAVKEHKNTNVTYRYGTFSCKLQQNTNVTCRYRSIITCILESQFLRLVLTLNTSTTIVRYIQYDGLDFRALIDEDSVTPEYDFVA